MGKGESQEWSEELEDTKQTQPESHQTTESKRSGRSCPTCCLKTRDCLMSNECGRALQISSVVAFCGMCIRMWVCKCQKGFPAGILLISPDERRLICYVRSHDQLLTLNPGESDYVAHSATGSKTENLNYKPIVQEMGSAANLCYYSNLSKIQILTQSRTLVSSHVCGRLAL